MPPKVPARCARGRFQHVNVKLGRPPTAPALSIANIGTSARPGGSYWSILYETVAAREAVPGPEASSSAPLRFYSYRGRSGHRVDIPNRSFMTQSDRTRL
jgi:hypothetical protein